MWLGSGGGGAPSVHECHRTNVDHYYAAYPRARYASVRATIERLLGVVLDVFAEHDIPHFLAYGTLLGWRRERRVIAHDDDADLVLCESLHARLLGMRDVFAARGLYLTSYTQNVRRIMQIRDHPHQRTVDKDECGFIDVYFTEPRLDTNRVVDHWNFWVYRASDVYPLRETTMLGRRTFVPRRHDALLRVLYGADFMTPVAGRKFRPVYRDGFAALYTAVEDDCVDDCDC
jgi:hypothetical protein